ncbi:Methylsterol monooxygenase 2-2 [Blyttiomyces sp. JEL0837]|nr:Methylsterol monooxygenase 2-2 [Blyttiomyces sp. JEL0837]
MSDNIITSAWHASLDMLQSLPEPTSTILTYAIIPYAATTSANAIVSISAEFLDNSSLVPKWFHDKYKIKYNGKRDTYPFKEVLAQSLKAQTFLLASALSGAVIFPPFLKMTRDIPGPVTFVGSMLGMALLDDLWFYFNHRALHQSKWLWENVHSIHHKMMTPTALSTNYLHPLEMLLVSVGTVVGVIVVRPHYVPFLTFVFLRTLEDVGNHSGWDFPFLPSRWIPFHVTAKFHDTHHATSNYSGKAKNLATTFTFWDMLFGSYSRSYVKKVNAARNTTASGSKEE